MPSIALCDGGLFIYNALMFYVYTLKSENFDEIYTGFTKDLKKRMIDHNSGKSSHTKKFKPWKLITYTAFENEPAARAFEKYLKTGSGIAFARKHYL